MDAGELPDDDYPLVLNTGRLQHQWHTMTKTGKVAKLNKLNRGPFVEIHPVDATALGIADGQQVELTSRRGRAVLPAVVTDRVRPGNCFVPFHWNDEHGEYLTINALTNDAVDADSLQPEFKVCAVQRAPVGSASAPTRVEHTAVVGERRRAPGGVGVADRHRRALRRRPGRRLGDSQLVNMDDCTAVAARGGPRRARSSPAHSVTADRRTTGPRSGIACARRTRRPRRRSLRGAGHRRPFLWRLLRAREVGRRQAGRPRRHQAAGPGRMRGLRA